MNDGSFKLTNFVRRPFPLPTQKEKEERIAFEKLREEAERKVFEYLDELANSSSKEEIEEITLNWEKKTNERI